MNDVGGGLNEEDGGGEGGRSGRSRGMENSREKGKRASRRGGEEEWTGKGIWGSGRDGMIEEEEDGSLCICCEMNELYKKS
jgi:hypothetical protein